MDRRTFVGTAAGALLTASASRALAESMTTDKLGRIGLQLYTVRDHMKVSVPDTLAAVARAGYKEVEFAGYFEHSAKDIRKMLDDNGLVAPSSHVDMPDLGPKWDALIEYAGIVGHEYLVCPWIDDGDRTISGYQRLAARFNAAGEKAERHGLKFGYHNHSFEFSMIDGEIPYDLLLKECDPKHVVMELDVFWAAAAGFDPLKYLDSYPGRFPMLHLKDMGPAPAHAMLDVGDGTIDWKKILRLGKKTGVKHVFVEHDEPPDSYASMKSSYRYLRALRY